MDRRLVPEECEGGPDRLDRGDSGAPASTRLASVKSSASRANRPEAEPFWKSFLRLLADRGLRWVKLVISDDHKGLRSAAGKVFHAMR